MIRLFIALKIPAEIKKQIVTLRDKIYSPAEKIKWEPVEKLHLTLKFIGEVPEENLDTITESISFIKDYKKFSCSFTGFGFFFKNKDPKILWAGFKTDNRVEELAGRLNKHFTAFSVPAEERKFKAHITLLRVKRKLDKAVIESFQNFKAEEIPFAADEVALIKSELLPSGSKYHEIINYKLL